MKRYFERHFWPPIWPPIWPSNLFSGTKCPTGRHPGTPQYPPPERAPHTPIQRPIHPVPIRSHTKPIRGHTTRNKSIRKPAIGMGTKKPQKAPKQPCGKTSPKPKARIKTTSNLSPKFPQLLNPNESQFNLPKHFVLNPYFLTLSFPVYSITNPSHFVLWGINRRESKNFFMNQLELEIDKSLLLPR